MRMGEGCAFQSQSMPGGEKGAGSEKLQYLLHDGPAQVGESHAALFQHGGIEEETGTPGAFGYGLTKAGKEGSGLIGGIVVVGKGKVIVQRDEAERRQAVEERGGGADGVRVGAVLHENGVQADALQLILLGGAHQETAQGQKRGLGEAGEKGGLEAGKNDLRRLMPPGTAGASGTILMTAVIHEKHLRDKYEHNGKGI